MTSVVSHDVRHNHVQPERSPAGADYGASRGHA